MIKSYADEIAASMQMHLEKNRELFGSHPLDKRASAPAEVRDEDIEISTSLTREPPKTAAQKMDDNAKLVKSAFAKLMSASTDLEDAGFDVLSANALVLVDHLIKEAKAKKEKMSDKDKEKLKKTKEKEKEEKLKNLEKARKEKDKNDAKDKAAKEKEKMVKERDAQRKKLNKMQDKAKKE